MSRLLLIFSLVFCTLACQPTPEQESEAPSPAFSSEASDEAMRAALQTHLDAVSNRDIESLSASLSPSGRMELILPGTTITKTTNAFLSFHREWFQDTTWSFETTILDSQTGPMLGIATVEAMYREPERDGQPYFNRMAVSYSLEQVDGRWYVIKDHACSLEKSTD